MTNDDLIASARELVELLRTIEAGHLYGDDDLIQRAKTLHGKLGPVYLRLYGHFPLMVTEYPPHVWMRRAKEAASQALAALESGMVSVPTQPRSTWDEREGPILDAVAGGESGRDPSFADVVNMTGLASKQVEIGLRALLDAGYLTGVDASSLAGFDVIGLRLTERARRQLGLWPDAPSEPGAIASGPVLAGRPSGSDFEYDVAVSYATADLPAVKAVVEALRSEGIRVFFDQDEAARLWGEDLTTELAEVYSTQAQYVMPFLSGAYSERDWTRFELEVATKAAKQRSTAYVLPVVVSTDVPAILGIPRTIGYVSLVDRNPEEIAQLLSAKLRQTSSD